jgi:hypothetical protein
MLPFSRHISAACTVYDSVDAPVRATPAGRLDLERELLEIADLVFTDGYDHPALAAADTGSTGTELFAAGAFASEAHPARAAGEAAA